MKKKIAVWCLTFTSAACVAMTGCASGQKAETSAAEAEASTAAVTEAETTEAASESSTEESSETAGLANPWADTDKEGIEAATGFTMTAPEGAEDVHYRYLASEGLAELTYTLNDEKWTYRMKSTDTLEDLSGIYVDWSSEEDDQVSGRDAKSYTYVNLNDETVDDIMLVNWYDVVTGVSYSLSVTGSDLNGLDLPIAAEEIYEPLQSEATDDPEADRRNELKDYFLGEHTRSEDGSSLKISENADGSFKVDLDVTRLCSLENGAGSFNDHKLSFTIEDPSGNDLTAVIYRDNDNSLSIRVLESSWENLPKDEVLEGFGK